MVTLNGEPCENVLVMYQGPHAYISSSWYSHENALTYKLSQNRNGIDYLSIIEYLQKEGNPNSMQMADVMKERVNKF